MKIRFLVSRTVKDGSGTVFKKDCVYDLPEPSAQHWLNRAVAEIAGPASKVSKAGVETAEVRAAETTESVTALKVPRSGRPRPEEVLDDPRPIKGHD